VKSEELEQAVRLLSAGNLVAFPTETVYGLGADAANPLAVAKIFAAKGRPADHPLIVHIPDASHLARWAREVPHSAHTLAAMYWPGPMTLILKKQPDVSDAVTGGQNTVGLRVPRHPLALQLLKAFADAGGSGIAAPSANRFGRISPTTAQHVHEEFGDAIALILDGGPCDVGIESTIVDLSRGPPVVLRPGAVTAEHIAAMLDREVKVGAADNAPRVSGSLAAHYAPVTPMRLTPSEHIEPQLRAANAQGLRVAVLARRPAPGGTHHLHWLIAAADAAGFAHDLYANLRRLDRTGADLILVETPPPEWQAVCDRLMRAECGAGS
jgi:L-threonylcarbamoyladenylate synthase